MDKTHTALAIIVTAGVTAVLRFLPFIVFGGKRKTPAAVLFLGKALPAAIMGMLCVYCLRDISFHAASGFLPQLIAAAVTAGLYILKKNSLVSIIGGTASYMLLSRLVFV